MKIIIILILLILFILLNMSSKFTQDFAYKNQQIVISRYNEDLDWTMKEPFNKHPMIVYNKGVNSDYTKSGNIIKEFKLPNVGREAHTYLYHIINNYNDLPDVTIFLMGSITLPHKYSRAINMVNKVEETNSSVFACGSLGDQDQNIHEYNFVLSEYGSGESKNFSINSNTNLHPSPVRPYGKWYETHFKNNERNNCVAINALFSVSKKHILQKPKSHYERLIKEVNTHSDHETGHYFERSWYAVFYPYGDEVSYTS